jgi:hypothetical protein
MSETNRGAADKQLGIAVGEQLGATEKLSESSMGAAGDLLGILLEQSEGSPVGVSFGGFLFPPSL